MALSDGRGHTVVGGRTGLTLKEGDRHSSTGTSDWTPTRQAARSRWWAQRARRLHAQVTTHSVPEGSRPSDHVSAEASFSLDPCEDLGPGGSPLVRVWMGSVQTPRMPLPLALPFFRGGVTQRTQNKRFRRPSPERAVQTRSPSCSPPRCRPRAQIEPRVHRTLLPSVPAQIPG